MNFRRILSKSSLKSTSTATAKSANHSDEIPRLQEEVEILKQTIESLKVSVESRDAAIGTLAREKEKIYVELKSVQRTNRNLHQQLVDERDMHSKEKDYLIEEIKRLTRNEADNMKHDSLDDITNYSQNDELKAKDEVIYKICKKYLKVKSSKQFLQKSLEKLQLKSQKMCEDVIILLQQNRISLDSLLSKMIKAATTPPRSRQYLKLLKVNSSLHFENTELKVRLSVNDFSKEHEVEITDRDTSTSEKCTKSEGKLQIVKNKYIGNRRIQHHREHQSNIIKLREYEHHFYELHSKFSPYFRRKKCYQSDPCLVK